MHYDFFSCRHQFKVSYGWKINSRACSCTLGLPSRQEQDQLANRIIEENLTVREIEKIVRDGTLA